MLARFETGWVTQDSCDDIFCAATESHVSGKLNREMLQNWSASFLKRNALLRDGRKRWLLHSLLCNNTTIWQPTEHTDVKKVFQTLSGDEQAPMLYHNTVKQVSRIPTCFSVKSSLMRNEWSRSLYKWRRPAASIRNNERWLVNAIWLFVLLRRIPRISHFQTHLSCVAPNQMAWR